MSNKRGSLHLFYFKKRKRGQDYDQKQICNPAQPLRPGNWRTDAGAEKQGAQHREGASVHWRCDAGDQQLCAGGAHPRRSGTQGL